LTDENNIELAPIQTAVVNATPALSPRASGGRFAAYRKVAASSLALARAGTNIKIMEAMAMGKAVVSTPAGVNGLTFDEGNELLIARTGPEMASAIQRLFDDPAERLRIGRLARLAVEERYGWPSIGRKQSDLYQSLLRP